MNKISIELAINDHTNFQICMWKTGLNLLTYRKITDLSDVRTVSFWWKIYFCPRFINQNTAQKLKVDFSSKANSSNFHYFLPPIGTVVYVPQCHDACMQELSTPFDIPWAIENAVMALALDPLLLGRWLQHTARHLWQVVRCTAFQHKLSLDER